MAAGLGTKRLGKELSKVQDPARRMPALRMLPVAHGDY